MDTCDQSLYVLFYYVMILLLFWGHEPCIGFFLWRFKMPDTLICYPGSIEKLKLLGATYLLLTYRSWDTPQKCHFTLGFCMLNFLIAGCPCCSLYQNERWEDSYVLVLLPLSFCSTLRGPFRRHFPWRTCPSRAIRRVHRLHAWYNCHSLIRFVNSYIVIIFVYVHEGFAEKGLPMLWCSSSRA
jgi:hypothetical protein